MGTWTNSDGLYITYGPDEVIAAKAGELLKGQGDLHQVEVDLDYTQVASATATIVKGKTVVIPDNAFIERIQVVTLTAWDSAADNFVLNLGLQRLDRSTELDYNGFIAALPQASMDPAGEVQEIIIGHTYVGALVGTVLTNPGLITADYDTGAPTAGRSTIRIFYRFV